MILSPSPRSGAGRVTLDQFVQANAGRFGNAMALYDAPDRPLWTEGAPRRFTWAQIEAAATAVGARLAELGLTSDSVVAIQGPNSSDTLLAILGCLKANLIPALLPANWRNAEAAAAVARVGARAIFAATRAGPAHPADTLRYVAADNFSVRFVCGFGAETPDGVVPFEDCLTEPAAGDAPRSKRLGNPAEHVAIVTFDCGPSGFHPVARTHNEWLAAGLAVLADLGLGHDDVLLSTFSPCSFAGLAAGMVPWLLSGSMLTLHQAFDSVVLDTQIERHGVTHLVLPSVALQAALAEERLAAPSLRRLCGLTRRADVAAALPPGDVPACEFAVFGELGLMPTTRSAEGAIALSAAPLAGPGAEAAPPAVELAVAGNVLLLRGAMVPAAGFPGPDRGGAYPLKPDGFVSSDFPARLEDGAIRITGPRPDIVSIGGHAYSLAALDSHYADAPGALSLNTAAADDPILGQHLAISVMPEAGQGVSETSLVMHAEGKSLSPLAMTTDVAIGDRRKAGRLAGAA